MHLGLQFPLLFIPVISVVFGKQNTVWLKEVIVIMRQPNAKIQSTMRSVRKTTATVKTSNRMKTREESLAV